MFVITKSPRGSIKKYKFIGIIDVGGTSKVYKVMRRRDAKIFVIKRISADDRIIFNNEVNILKKIHHKNIVKYKERIKCDIVMEYINGELLYDKIKQTGGCHPDYVCSITKQIVKALKYLKNQHIIHNDLKPENIICLPNDKIKIIDFGYSTVCKGNKYYGNIEFGTIYYTSPEIITREKPYTHAIDIWSLGVLVYCTICGYLPFYNKKKSKVYKKILCDEVYFPDEDWNYVNQDAKKFITATLEKLPSNRPSAGKLLKFAWLARVKNI